MPRDTRTRRLTGPSGGGVSTAYGGDGSSAPLVSLLARATRLTDLLPPLHERALEATGGSCSLLFETNPRTGVMQATSAFGLDTLRTDPWMPGPGESDLVSDAFSRSAATLIVDADRQMPNLAERIGTSTALLLPLARGRERVGLLVVGYSGTPDRSARADSAQIADAFLTAIELSRLRQSDELQHDLRELLDEFSKQSCGDDEPGRRARRLLPRRESAVRRRPDVGLDSRSARAASRVEGVVGSRAHRARRPRGRRRSALARRVDDAPCTRGDHPAVGRRGDVHRHRPAARHATRARHDRLRRRARRGGRRARPARSRRRDRPSALERDRKSAAARRRGPVAAGAGEHLRLDRASDRRRRSARSHRAREPGVRESHRLAARPDDRPAARRVHRRRSSLAGFNSTIERPSVPPTRRRPRARWSIRS